LKRRSSGSLTFRTEGALRRLIQDGPLQVGDKLPTEKALALEFGVSRTVVREAIAALRAEELLVARHGVGVFVAERDAVTTPGDGQLLTMATSAIPDMVELRMAVETHAAGLAAARRSWAQEAKILGTLDQMRAAIDSGQPSEEPDLAFHLAIAEATNNGLFVDFLVRLGTHALPRSGLAGESKERLISKGYLEKTLAEHRAICVAISLGDVEGARRAMTIHLGESQARYRMLIFPESEA
jgi:GntR family transcriptional regulator, transcriptional repressor for pyruvate dehydrogenase complex